MGNCKDCKFWEEHQDGRKEWNTCEAADWVEYGDVIGESDIAIYATALDDTGLMTGLKTGPMFGCVKFQPSK